MNISTQITLQSLSLKEQENGHTHGMKSGILLIYLDFYQLMQKGQWRSFLRFSGFSDFPPIDTYCHPAKRCKLLASLTSK